MPKNRLKRDRERDRLEDLAMRQKSSFRLRMMSKGKKPALKEGDKDWTTKCSSCGGLPTVHPVGLCGPCTWGEAETAGGNW